jgi:hypothetical protein
LFSKNWFRTWRINHSKKKKKNTTGTGKSKYTGVWMLTIFFFFQSENTVKLRVPLNQVLVYRGLTVYLLLFSCSLLYYYIIDLSTTNKQSATHKVFSSKERKRYTSGHHSRFNIITSISSATKAIIKVVIGIFKEDILVV